MVVDNQNAKNCVVCDDIEFGCFFAVNMKVGLHKDVIWGKKSWPLNRVGGGGGSNVIQVEREQTSSCGTPSIDK